MNGKWITGRLMIGVTAACLAVGGAQGTALADSHTVQPPDRVDRIGALAPNAPPQLPPDRVDRIGVMAPDAPPQLPPDRVDGLGSARLPTVPTPITVVRTVPAGGYDWLAAVSGAAIAMALVLVAGAARLVRTHRLAVD
jgi:hypothetical protein